MSFHDKDYKDGIFTCTLSARINEDDARQWAHLCKYYSDVGVYPIVALLNLKDANYITAIARQIISRIADSHYVHSMAVIVDNFLVEQNIQLIAMMSAGKAIAVFSSPDEALQYAENHAKLLHNLNGKVPDVF